MLTKKFSRDLGTEVSIESVRFYPIRKIVVNDFLVKDQQHDSLIYVEQISAPIDSFNLKRKQIYLGQVNVNRLHTNLSTDSTRNNYSFIVDSLLSQQKSARKWQLNLKKIRIKNSAFSYQNSTAPPSQTKFNPNDIGISSLSLLIDKIVNKEGELSVRIKDLSAQERSGLLVKKSKAEITVGKRSFTLRNLLLTGKYSFISLGKLQLQLDSVAGTKDFINTAALELQVNSVSLDYRECELLIPNFPVLNHRINLRGDFTGTIADLKGRNININAGTDTHLETSFDITGLPNFRQSYVFLDVKRLSTNIVDLNKILSINAQSEDVDLPESFKRMGSIEYSGKFSGFVDNLVAYGSFRTDLGNINTDLGIKITEDDKLIYSGFINTKKFNIGKMLNWENSLNNVSMDVSVQGYNSGKRDFNSYIKGTIDSIDIRGYKYEEIELNGLISNKRFNGEIELNDPNAQLLFNGIVDFSDNIPQFDFSAVLNNIKLDKLNIAPKLIGSNMSLMLNSSLNGTSINTLSGSTLLHKGKLWIDNQTFLLDSLVVQANQNQSPKEISLHSDLLDTRLTGNFNASSISKAIKQVLAAYFPAFFSFPKETTSYTDQFDFAITTKKLAKLMVALQSNLTVADSTSINGSVNSYNKQLQIQANSNEIKYNSLWAKNIKLEINTLNNQLNSHLHTDIFGIGKLIPLGHFTIEQNAANDSIDLQISWKDMDQSQNKGRISTQTRIKKTKEGDIYTKINLMPSFVIVKDSLWTIQDSEINLTPIGLRVNTFRLHHGNQEININGSLYKNDKGKLTTYFQNIDLHAISSLLNLNGIRFDGFLNGSLELKDSFDEPVITSQLTLDGFKINNEDIGDLKLQSNWSNLQNAVLVKALVQNGNSWPLSGTGYFKPADKDYSFDFKLDSLPLGLVNMYTSSAIQNLRGTGSGNLRLLKTEYGFGMEGGIKVNKAKFDVDLLQCSFFVEDSVIITPESFVFKDMTLTDPRGRNGRFTGSILHRRFRNMHFDLYVHANNMLLLNTKEKDNPLYYGTVYADGDLAVRGTTYDLSLDINGQSKRNTKLYIPISNDTETLDNNFIQFISHNDSLKTTNHKQEEYKVEATNYNLNMSADITPDAQIQVIFKSAGGNVLQSWGKGSLQIQMDKEGEITFLGDYTAEKGDYLFSLENVVNKRFDINKGGSIVWEGSPYDAMIDITATYKLKTSLQSLNPSSSASNDISGRVPINVDLILSNRLSQPNINFNITAPTLEQSTQTIVREAISTEEELNRQVLSLLVLNKFYTPSYNSSGSSGQSSNLANAYTYELLSGQLSNLVSQMLDDVDVGISYRPENEISSEQIEVALSTQIFNDRVTLNGNVEYGKYGRFGANNPNSSNIVGDFDLDVKLNQSGSLRAKAYTRSNDDFSFDNSPTTQGIGLSYQEEFDTVGELMRKYWNWITGRKSKGKTENSKTVKK
ncbi:translocation/assembly module TamB domain-containing protein [Saccharicrinis carchari]|nr:translocation/assembly module TamB domain-containing protein [Saccharicrinis carchari]